MNAIPRIVRDKFSLEWLQNKETVSWSDLPRDLKQRIWDIYNDAIFPAYKENKLGVIVFQFPLNFHPSDDNRRHVEECRGFLKEEYKMVVEFRSRMWFTEDNLQRTTAWLRNNDIGIVIADELHHELYFDSKPTTGASSAASGCPTSADVVPIVMALGSPKVCYIRVHRRVGTQRLLKEDEIHKWVERLKSDELQKRIEGPIYFMWGTDHEDQPIINSKNLTSAINDIAYKWIPTMPHGQCLLNFVPKKISSNKTGAVVENSSRQESTHDHPNGIKKKIADEMDSKNNNSQNDTSQSLPSTPTHSPSKKIRLQGNKSPKQVKLQKGQKQISSFFTKINKSQNT